MAWPLLSAFATFFRAVVSILCTVPRDTLIFAPASACVRSSRSQSFKASSSSRKRGMCSTSAIGTPAGLKASPLNVHLQFLGFLYRGDILALPHIVHMHTSIPHRCDHVKKRLSFINTGSFPLRRSVCRFVIIWSAVDAKLGIFFHSLVMHDIRSSSVPRSIQLPELRRPPAACSLRSCLPLPAWMESRVRP